VTVGEVPETANPERIGELSGWAPFSDDDGRCNVGYNPDVAGSAIEPHGIVQLRFNRRRKEFRMSKATEVLRGIVHGKSIELEHPLPMPDGSQIELVVKHTPISAEQQKQRLEAIFGSCEQDAEDLDEFLGWNREQRKHSRPELDL
jgi:hypothetical protein